MRIFILLIIILLPCAASGQTIANCIEIIDSDWFNIPGEKIYFQNDSLHFERFRGFEKYDGKILPVILDRKPDNFQLS